VVAERKVKKPVQVINGRCLKAVVGLRGTSSRKKVDKAKRTTRRSVQKLYRLEKDRMLFPNDDVFRFEETFKGKQTKW
jgi:hypothetical protein